MEFDEIVVKESPGLCRCCLSEGCYKDMGTEYSWMSENEVYAEMLLECFDISISQHNEGPNGPNRLICEVCITRLRDACYFKKQVLDSEKKFVDMVGRGEFKSKVIVYQTQLKTERPDELDVTIEPGVEYLDDEMDFGDDDLPKPDEPSVSEVTADPLPVRKRGRPRKTTLKPETKKKLKVERKAKTVVKEEKESPKALNGHKANTIMRSNLQIVLNNTSLIPFKWRGKFICFYCGSDTCDYEEMKRHTKSHSPCIDGKRALMLIKGQDSEVKFDQSDGIVCSICQIDFTNIDDITAHLKIKHKLPYDKSLEIKMVGYRMVDLKCLPCNKTFENFFRLIQHVNLAHSEGCFQCHDCGQKFTKKRDLANHLNYYHRQEYKCKLCNLIFKNRVKFLKHKARPHVIMCIICLEKFPSNKKRLDHMHNEHFSKPHAKLMCGFCKKQFATKIALMNHVGYCPSREKKSRPHVAEIDLDNRKQVAAQIKANMRNLINLSTALPFRYSWTKFKCFFCEESFTHAEDLKQHTTTAHQSCEEDHLKQMRPKNYKLMLDISTLSCKLCNEPFQDMDTFIDHLLSEHKTDYDKSVPFCIESHKLKENEFPCLKCNESFELFRYLLKHISIHHRKNENICVHCGKSFHNNSALNMHIATKHKPGGYKCEECSMEFETSHLLNGHMGKAHGKVSSKCRHCPEMFTSVYIMRRHMIEVHDHGYKCSYCGKLFTNNSFMLQHVRRTHLKEKNVECSICFERFFDTRLLKIHMVKHVGIRNFHCDVCGKSFLWKKNLSSHMKSHNK